MPYVNVLCRGSDTYQIVVRHIHDPDGAFEAALIAGFELAYRIQHQPTSFRINPGKFDANAKHMPSIEVQITTKSVGGSHVLATGGAAFLRTAATHMLNWHHAQYNNRTATLEAFAIPTDLVIALTTDGTTIGARASMLTRIVEHAWGCELPEGARLT